MTTLVVRAGADSRLPSQLDPETGMRRDQHTLLPVYGEMLLQICRDYPGLPDARSLTLSEIRFFYEGMRATLKRRTQPPKQST